MVCCGLAAKIIAPLHGKVKLFRNQGGAAAKGTNGLLPYREPVFRRHPSVGMRPSGLSLRYYIFPSQGKLISQGKFIFGNAKLIIVGLYLHA